METFEYGVWWQYPLIVGIGVIAGFFNTVAGGGSLLTLPVLIFLGLPPALANGTNRVAIFIQNIFAVSGFKSKGVFEYPYAVWLAISALIGAVVGAKLAVDIDGVLFNRLLAIIMIFVVATTVFNPMKANASQTKSAPPKRNVLTIILFFFVGIYGGFIQAGVGFIMIAILTLINGFSLVRTNSIKVFVVMIYTVAALLIFILEDKIDWTIGLTLAMGNAMGGWFASRWSVDKGDKWVRVLLIIAVTGLAVKLWFFN